MISSRDLGLVDPHLIGFPEDLNLDRSSRRIASSSSCQLVILQAFTGDEDAAQILHQGAALGLGGVGGEDGQIDQLVEQLLQLLFIQPLGVEFAQYRIERAGPERTADTHHAAALLVLERLFGDVRQTEIEAEGAHHMGHGLGVELANQLVQTLALARVLLLAQADIAAPQGFHSVENAGSCLAVEHVAQQVAEKLDPCA